MEEVSGNHNFSAHFQRARGVTSFSDILKIVRKFARCLHPDLSEIWVVLCLFRDLLPMHSNSSRLHSRDKTTKRN